MERANKDTLKVGNEPGEVISNFSARLSKSVFNTGRLDQGQSMSFQFDVPGESSYSMAEHRYWPALQKPQSASPESK